MDSAWGACPLPMHTRVPPSCQEHACCVMNGQPSFLGKSLEAESLGRGPHFFITNGHSQIALACHFGETSQKIKKKKKIQSMFCCPGFLLEIWRRQLLTAELCASESIPRQTLSINIGSRGGDAVHGVYVHVCMDVGRWGPGSTLGQPSPAVSISRDPYISVCFLPALSEPGC